MFCKAYSATLIAPDPKEWHSPDAVAHVRIGREGARGRYLVHVINKFLNLWLRISQKLENRGDPREKAGAPL